MLRNLNRSYTRGRVCGTPYVGLLGSQIASSGDNGPGYAYNDISLPADANKRYRGRIVAWPSAGDFAAGEATDFTFSGAPDGVYPAQYQLDEWDESGAKTSFSPTTITLTVGSANVSIVGAWTEANDTAAGSGSLTVSGTSATAEANDTASGVGTVGNVVSGTATWTESNDTASASGTVTAGSVTGTAGWTEASDTTSASGTSAAVSFARAPRGSGYRRPFYNTKRPKNEG